MPPSAAGPVSGKFGSFARLASLPPYVLAAVDELKSQPARRGHDVFDFGLGNPDGPSPHAAIEPPLSTRRSRPGNQRYMPSQGLPETRQAICDWYQRRYGQSSIPRRRRSSRSARRKASRTCCSRSSAPATACCRPTPAIRSTASASIIAGGEPVPVATGPGQRSLQGDRGGARARAAQAEGPDRQLPAQPDQRGRRSGVLREGRARCATARSLWVISDLAYADLVHDGSPAPSIFQVQGARDVAVEFFTVSKSYSMPGWRVGFCVGNGRWSARWRRSRATSTTASSRPTQLAAAHRARHLRRRRRGEPRASTSTAPRLLVQRAGGGRLAGRRCRCASMFVWAPLPAAQPLSRRARSTFASELLSEARVAVSPGVGFGPGGEGFVRFALVEPDDRATAGLRAPSPRRRTEFRFSPRTLRGFRTSEPRFPGRRGLTKPPRSSRNPLHAGSSCTQSLHFQAKPRSSTRGTSPTSRVRRWAAPRPRSPTCCAASTARRSRRTPTPATSWWSSTPRRSS